MVGLIDKYVWLYHKKVNCRAQGAKSSNWIQKIIYLAIYSAYMGPYAHNMGVGIQAMRLIYAFKIKSYVVLKAISITHGCAPNRTMERLPTGNFLDLELHQSVV